MLCRHRIALGHGPMVDNDFLLDAVDSGHGPQAWLYCDPLQITQKAWNDAAIFVDFDKDLPRDFRLGVFSDLKAWNPENIPWEKWPVEKRPMVTVKRPPFTKSAWTHVALTLNEINSDKTESTLYLNGLSQGTLKQPVRFSWEPSLTTIMLGIEYIAIWMS